MDQRVSLSANDIWLRQLFAAQAARSGGVVRRNIHDVDRKIGRDRLEVEVRRRGFHLLKCGGQFVIICDKNDLTMVC
jgi:hypothetical protein